MRVILADDAVLIRQGLARLFVDQGDEVSPRSEVAPTASERPPNTSPTPRRRYPDAAHLHRRAPPRRA